MTDPCPKHNESLTSGRCVGCETDRLIRDAFDAYHTAPLAEAYLAGVHAMASHVAESAGALLARRALQGQPALRRLEHTHALLLSQDNRSTAHPIYVVERRVRDFGYEPEYSEEQAWVCAEDELTVTKDSDPELFAKFQDGIFDGEHEGDEGRWETVGYKDRWEFVQPFLTREAAETYRKNEAHNLGEARVFVASGHRNPEWAWLRDLLGAGEAP